jgi:hypothetical protein
MGFEHLRQLSTLHKLPPRWFRSQIVAPMPTPTLSIEELDFRHGAAWNEY